ncbi:MAG: AsmA-like C-terminal region-containing protein [Pirellulaceae bacterium]
MTESSRDLPVHFRHLFGQRKGSAHFRGFLWVMCFLVMSGALGLTLVKQLVHDKIRDQILTEINGRLAGTTFVASIDQAHWIEGSGLNVRRVNISDRRTGQPVVAIEHVYVQSSFQLTHILAGMPSIDSVAVDGLEVICRTDEAGHMNVRQLMEKLKCDDQQYVDFPLHLRNSSVTLDMSCCPLGTELTIGGINGTYRRHIDNRQLETVEGSLSTQLVGRVDFKLDIDRASDVWNVVVDGQQINIHEDLAKLFCQLTNCQRTPLRELRGQLAVSAAVTGRISGGEMPQFRILGQAANVHCLDPNLPHQIHNGSCEFEFNNNDLVISDATCQLGYGSARANLVVTDWMNQRNWHLQGAVDQFELTPRLVQWLPAKMQRVWRQYQPGGIIAGTFDVRSKQGQIIKNLHATVSNGTCSWYRFPFAMSRVNGTISWVDRALHMDLTAVESRQLVQMKGRINDPGDYWTGWFEIACDDTGGGIPINEKLWQGFDYLRPELARTLRRFNATGAISGTGRLERLDPNSKVVNRRFDVQLNQGTVRYDAFDYPFYNVVGRILVENDLTKFETIRGVNNNGQVVCNGTWDDANGLRLRFLAETVTLDDELKHALPAHLQETWHAIRPSGTMDLVDLDLHYHPATDLKIDVEAEVRSSEFQQSTVTINPVWFPYEMRQVTGRFRFHESRIDIEDFAARHGRTTVRANATGAWSSDRWRIRFSDLIAGNIVLDQPLMAALPQSLAEGLEYIEFAGHLNMRGALEIAGNFYRPQTASNEDTSSYYVATTAAQPTANFGWNLELGIGQASAVIGLPVHNANGVLALRGQVNNDELNCNGTLILDSLMYEDIQVTSISAPVSINNHQIGIGSLASSKNPNGRPPSATARLFGGALQCDAQVQLGGDNEYFLQAGLSNGSLARFFEEVSIQQHNISGEAFADLRLYGNSTGAHAVRGDGKIQLKNAHIYDLPVILALLKVLRIREPDRTMFDEGQLAFNVAGDNIDFQKIELNGDTLSLIGKGNVNLDSEIDLDFYTMVGRNRFFIPILTELYQAGSQQVWWIEVDGTLEQPRTEHRVLPALNDSLKLLFPELEEESQR